MVVQSCIRLTNFVDVDLWQNIDVECRLEAEKNVDLHFARTPPHPPPAVLALYLPISGRFINHCLHTTTVQPIVLEFEF